MNSMSRTTWAATAISSLLLACQSHASDAIQLRVTSASPGYAPAIEAVTKAFMEKYPGIEIALDPPRREPQELLQQTLRDAIVGNTADVSFQGLASMSTLADRGVVVPLQGFFDLDKDGISETAKSMIVSGKDTTALPFSVAMPIVYYNLDLVEKAAGKPIVIPTTWDDLLALCSKISKVEPGTIGCHIEYDSSGNYTYQTLIGSFGGAMMNADRTKITFDSPEGLSALDILAKFGRAGMIDMTRDQARQNFSAGKVGIHLGVESLYDRFKKQSSGSFKIGIGPTPLASPAGQLPAGGIGVVMLTKDEKRQQAAWQYIRFAASREGQLLVYKAMGTGPTDPDVLSDTAFVSALNSEELEKLKEMSSVRQIKAIRGWFSFPGVNEFKAVDTVQSHLEAVVTLRETPEAALKAMTAEVNALLFK